ncbi:MAG: DUF4258 domain-containing protein [Nitrospirota bacterium]
MNDEATNLPISDFISKIREVAGKKIIYTLHAVDEMNAEDEIISKNEVREVIFTGEIIEEYPEDKRGHSCLMMCHTRKGRPVHLLCAPKEEYLAIITVYVPSLDKWQSNFKVRRKKP